MKKEKNKKVVIIKVLLLVLAIALIAGILIYFWPYIMKISTTEGQIELKNTIENAGGWGILILFALQLLQIFVFFIPGEPIEIMAGMCFGKVWGTVFIIVSSLIVSALIFFMVRKFGRKFVYEFTDKKKLEKIENSPLLQNTKKLELIVFILFFIPGTPKDLFVYMAGLLPIKPYKFLIISTFARIPSIVTSTILGNSILHGDWKLGVFFYSTILFVAILLVLIISVFDKDNTAENVLKTVNKK